MNMESDQIQQNFDNQVQRPDGAVSESLSGMSGLVDQQHAETQRLKGGGRSGISGEFGRPAIDGDYSAIDPGQPRRLPPEQPIPVGPLNTAHGRGADRGHLPNTPPGGSEHYPPVPIHSDDNR